MPKNMNIQEAYQAYFYENGAHLTGAAFVQAYKNFVMDAYNGEFILLDADQDPIRPKPERTLENLRKFQGTLDTCIQKHVVSLSGKEKQDALASDVIACTTADYLKIKCARFNMRELAEDANLSLSAYEKLSLRLACAFGANEPSKSVEGRDSCVEDLRSIAKGIKAHKPGIFTFIFRHATYNRRRSEYNDLKLKLECAINKVFFPCDKTRYFIGRDFRFLNLERADAINFADTGYREIMSDAEQLAPDTDFKSIYYPKEAEDFKTKNQEYIDSLSDDFYQKIEEDSKVEEPVAEEIRASEIKNAPEVKSEDAPERK